jgi:hypothetical protein
MSLRESKEPKSKVGPAARFSMCLLSSVTAAHILHFQATSYAEHVALGEYYDGMSDLVDDFVEQYQGLYSVIKDYGDDDDAKPKSAEAYLSALLDEVETLRGASGFPTHTTLQNKVDEIVALIAQTLYKLRFLS